MKRYIGMFFALMLSNAIALTDEQVKLYEMLADFGDANAQLNLGVHHIERFNNEEAMKWTLKAAESGLIGAQNNLGYMFHNGRAPGGVDFQKAFKWYLKAAEQGEKTVFVIFITVVIRGLLDICEKLKSGARNHLIKVMAMHKTYLSTCRAICNCIKDC